MTPQEVAMRNLEEKLLEYYPDVNLSLIRKAFDFSEKKHAGQLRSSGEPYMIHPVGVATILAELHLDLDSIITGLLHDTVEDTEATLAEVEKEFGKGVAELVDGVTKISRMTFRTSEEKQAENFRKMIVAMAKDLRVILVKLADRTHNMRTLEHVPEKKQKLTAQETLDIYAPLANRLGIHWIKAELEDLCLRYLKPEVYYRLAQQISKKKSVREKYIEDVQKVIIESLKEYGLNGQVSGRPKHFYSIFKKLEQRNSTEIEDVHDIIAFRIIVDNITECYKALGVIHAVFKPIPGRFKDYIAMPKPNNYQSLHTTVIGPFGERMEIQIRTSEMHQIAQSGVAAHWKYKEGRAADSGMQNKMDWLNRLLDSQKNLNDPNEFLESVKLDLYQGDVYIFTPKGEVKEFPHGSTPLDFAYSVHTDVGHRCVGAKVNGKIVPLKYRLKSGDVVEILTAPNQNPSKDWLKIVKTSRAMSKIRAFVKQEERDKAQELGEEILERELKRFQSNVSKVQKSGEIAKALKELGIRTIDDLFVSIGYGKTSAREVIRHVVPKEILEQQEEPAQKNFLQKIISTAIKRSDAKSAVMVSGMGDMLIRFAKCCGPIPGDPIVGFVTRGRGVTVHQAVCPKALDGDSARKVDVEWNRYTVATKENSTKTVTPIRAVRVRVLCDDSPGMLAAMTQVISSQGVNIKQATVRTLKEKRAVCVFEILVSGTEQLSKVISSLEAKPGIISVERQRN